MSDVNQLRPSWVRKIEVAHVEGLTVEGPCWLWRGAHNKPHGYGRVCVQYRTLYLHRVVYELLVGPIPEGLQLDHLCRQPACCAPYHLEPVTPLVNTRRGTDHNASKTHCPNRHEFTPENTYMTPGAKPRRVCRTCRAEYMPKWRAAQKQRQAATWALYLGTEQASA